MTLALLVAWMNLACADHKPIGFNPKFTASLNSPEFRLVKKQLRRHALEAGVKSPSFTDRNFIVFVQLFRQFSDYAREFSLENDRMFGNLGDFKAYYYRIVSQRFPWLKLQGEFSRLSVASDALLLKVQSGGAGARVDLGGEKSGHFSMVVLPLYGEKRDYKPVHPVSPSDSKSDFLLRISAGGSYEYELNEKTRGGIQLLYQPQVYDLGQYRIYAETYLRVRVYKSHAGNRYRIEEIYFVPKVIYWYSSDREGLLGDRIEDIFGSAYTKLDENFFGFFHLEFRFSN